METKKKKRGRPPKRKITETTGTTYYGAINYALDKEVRAELDKSLADKDESRLTESERKYLEAKHTNRTRTLNIRFSEAELQDIKDKCRQFGYKSKSTYVRDCIKARVDLPIDRTNFSETNRIMKSIGNNINQTAIRLHSTGNMYAEDMTDIKEG